MGSKWKDRYNELLARSKEVMNRISSPMPAVFIKDKWGLNKWKGWTIKPFVNDRYEIYTPENREDGIIVEKTTHKIIEVFNNEKIEKDEK